CGCEEHHANPRDSNHAIDDEQPQNEGVQMVVHDHVEQCRCGRESRRDGDWAWHGESETPRGYGKYDRDDQIDEDYLGALKCRCNHDAQSGEDHRKDQKCQCDPEDEMHGGWVHHDELERQTRGQLKYDHDHQSGEDDQNDLECRCDYDDQSGEDDQNVLMCRCGHEDELKGDWVHHGESVAQDQGYLKCDHDDQIGEDG
ncbi:hypothetical protein LTR40_008379, partial [Exophiala xenobiotica]